MRRRERIEPTDDWDQLVLLFEWPEQEEYELIRQPVLFGTSVAERARETGVPERTIYLKIERFRNEGPRGLFFTESAKRQLLPQTIRRMIVDLMAEHPALNNNEISLYIVYVRTGRKLGKHTVERVLSEEIVPLKLSRLFEPYHEIEDGRERRGAVVALHLDGWTADVRYLKTRMEEQLYVISILENYSRKIIASSVTRRQDLTAFLPVLYSAVEHYGPPQTLVTDGGRIFRVERALSIYEALGIEKEEIDQGQPWQSYIETTFNIQKKMADYHFARTETFGELVEAHARWMSDYNAQRHCAHEGREDGRHSPEVVLGFYTTTLRYRPEDLERAFFSIRFTRVLDTLGYTRFRDWRLYGEEGLAKREAAVWLQPGSHTLEYGGKTLSRYDVEVVASTGELQSAGRAQLFETSHATP